MNCETQQQIVHAPQGVEQLTLLTDMHALTQGPAKAAPRVQLCAGLKGMFVQLTDTSF